MNRGLPYVCCSTLGWVRPWGSCGSATTSYTTSSAAAATRMHMHMTWEMHAWFIKITINLWNGQVETLTNLHNSTPNSSNKTRNIRIHIRSIWTPKSGVSGPIPGVSPGVSGLIPGVSPGVFQNPEYPGLYPESPGLTEFSPQKLKSWFWQNQPTKIKTLLDPSWGMHIELIDQKKSLRTS